jgi:hypothetical protein
MLATVAVAVLGTQEATSAGLLFVGYVVSLSACAVWWLLTGDAPADGDRADVMAALAPARSTAEPERLVRLRELEHVVGGGTLSALDADARLRPALRDLARELLATRRGVVVGGDADLAALVGLPGEPLLGPRSDHRLSDTTPGPSAADLARVLAHLESL